MTVEQLIKELQKFDKHLPVIIWEDMHEFEVTNVVKDEELNVISLN